MKSVFHSALHGEKVGALLRVVALSCLSLVGCGWPQGSVIEIRPEAHLPTKTWRWELVRIYPHDPAAFTQGLLWHDGALYESVGLYGRSAIRRVDLTTGKALAEARLPSRYFGEGLALVGDELIQLTWREGIAFVWDRRTFELKRSVRYAGEGWGLAPFDGELILSDGTEILRALDPRSFRERRRIHVVSERGPVTMLNELETLGRLLLANVYQTNLVAVIDPSTGTQIAQIDFGRLFPESARTPEMDVLNGLAWREETRTLFVTGKNWPLLFEVKLFED